MQRSVAFLLVCLSSAHAKLVLPSAALRCRGGSSKWPPAPTQDAWAKHRAAARSVAPQKPTLRQESLDDVVDAKPLDELLDRDSRVVFVRRVYGLFSANLVLTAASCLYLSANPGVVRSMLSTPAGNAIMSLAMVGGIGASLAISFAPALRQSLPLFALFAASESLLVGVAASAYRVQSVALALARACAGKVRRVAPLGPGRALAAPPSSRSGPLAASPRPGPADGPRRLAAARGRSDSDPLRRRRDAPSL